MALNQRQEAKLQGLPLGTESRLCRWRGQSEMYPMGECQGASSDAKYVANTAKALLRSLTFGFDAAKAHMFQHTSLWEVALHFNGFSAPHCSNTGSLGQSARVT